MRVLNLSKKTTIAERAEMADDPLSRLRGLLGRDELPSGHGMVITQCRSIHMFFMKFPIDAIFVDRNDKAVGLVRRIRPFGMSPYFFRASYVVEVPEGTIDFTHTSLGDVIAIEGNTVEGFRP